MVAVKDELNGAIDELNNCKDADVEAAEELFVPTVDVSVTTVVVIEAELDVICVARELDNGEIDADRDWSEADVIAAEELFVPTTDVSDTNVTVTDELLAVIWVDRDELSAVTEDDTA
jgi:hypothetical protein